MDAGFNPRAGPRDRATGHRLKREYIVVGFNPRAGPRDRATRPVTTCPARKLFQSTRGPEGPRDRFGFRRNRS